MKRFLMLFAFAGHGLRVAFGMHRSRQLHGATAICAAAIGILVFLKYLTA